MGDSIAIIGGNIAGLSAAYYLAGKGCNVTVYERKIWDKPCGGAISAQFADYLHHHVGIPVKGANDPIRKVRCGFQSTQSILLDGIFIITSRYRLQEDLIAYLDRHPNVDFVFKRVSVEDQRLFTPQTVLATGFSAFTREIIQDQWRNREYALVYKANGHVTPARTPDCHLLLFDSRINGYEWIFIESDGTFNMGAGGLMDRNRLYQAYEEFRRTSVNIYNYSALNPTGRPIMWKIPIALHPCRNPLTFIRKNTEFIGVGDVLGLAHPIVGAGIEPAWQSGWLLGESYDPVRNRIDAEKYRHLLNQNLRLTSRKPIDRLAARMLRSVRLPLNERLAYIYMRLNKRSIHRSLNQYPWFAKVHDGRRRVNRPAIDPWKNR